MVNLWGNKDVSMGVQLCPTSSSTILSIRGNIAIGTFAVLLVRAHLQVVMLKCKNIQHVASVPVASEDQR